MKKNIVLGKAKLTHETRDLNKRYVLYIYIYVCVCVSLIRMG
jgi:hypothetical protein